MTDTPEKPKAGQKTPEQIEQETKDKLAKAKNDISPDTPVFEMIQGFFRDYKSMTHKERLERLGAIVFAITIGKLLDKPEKKKGKRKKGDGEGTQEEGAEESAEETPEETQTPAASGAGEPEKPADAAKPDDKKSDSEPALPPIDVEKFKKGDLLTAVIGLYPGVEAQGGLQALQTAKLDRHGVPGWDKKSTHEWDYAGAGNTDAEIQQGNYHIQATVEPNGYTRSGTDKVSGNTLKKLIRISDLLRSDPRMPLFKGIAMTVDGVQVMFVKEIHMHSMVQDKQTKEWKKSKPSLQDYYYRPHTGVSYIMKKTS